MRTHEAHGTRCALVQPLPMASGRAPHTAAVPFAHAKRSHGRKNCGPDELEVRITYIDRAIIRGYFGDHGYPCVMEPAENKALLPGVQEHWRTTATWLPPGLWKMQLPVELERKLSALPAGYARVLVDNDVLLVDTARRTIVDAMQNAYATTA